MNQWWQWKCFGSNDEKEYYKQRERDEKEIKELQESKYEHTTHATQAHTKLLNLKHKNDLSTIKWIIKI